MLGIGLSLSQAFDGVCSKRMCWVVQLCVLSIHQMGLSICVVSVGAQ